MDPVALDADIGLDNAEVDIDNDDIGDDAVKGKVGRDGDHLFHALMERLVATKFAPVVGEVSIVPFHYC